MHCINNKNDMKILRSSIIRALIAIAVGVLLIKYPDNTVTGIVIAIGIMFALSGIISVLTYLNARRNQSEYKIYDNEGRLVAGQVPMFPIVGIGSIILGGILALMPETFISFLMYIIGAILILGAISQYFNIIGMRRYATVSIFYWICPTLILMAGIYLIINPLSPLSTAIFFLGWLTLFYGVVEAVNSMMFYFMRRQWEKDQEHKLQVESDTIAEEIKENDTTNEVVPE